MGKIKKKKDINKCIDFSYALPQIVRQLMLECRKWHRERDIMWNQIKASGKSPIHLKWTKLKYLSLKRWKDYSINPKVYQRYGNRKENLKFYSSWEVRKDWSWTSRCWRGARRVSKRRVKVRFRDVREKASPICWFFFFFTFRVLQFTFQLRCQ